MEVDKSTCWYSNECISEMNRALEQEKKDGNVIQHIEVLKSQISSIRKTAKSVIDLGCGTGSSSPLFSNFIYVGVDLPHILNLGAKKNFPNNTYIEGDIVESYINYISLYDIVLVNGVVDVMEHPYEMLEKILKSAKQYVILHRQEIKKDGPTFVVKRPSYNSETFHSILSRSDFEGLLKKYNFHIIKELNCGFGNWEDGGHSFLLEKETSFALNDMDLKLDEIFGGKKNGFFIEAGANDGLQQSNTAFFEFYKNWKGILIEPVNKVSEQCKKNRPNSFHINFALCAPENNLGILDIRHFNGNNGLLSTLADTDMSKVTSETPQIIKVSCCTLNEILMTVPGIPPIIDLLVLDLEGYEEEAIKGIDFEKYKIEWLLIEHLECVEFNPAIALNKWYVLHSALSSHDYLFKRRN